MIKQWNHKLTTSLFTIIKDNLLKLPKRVYNLEEILQKYQNTESDQLALTELYKNSQFSLESDPDYIKLKNKQILLLSNLKTVLIEAYKSCNSRDKQNIPLHCNNLLYFEKPDTTVTLQIIPGSGGQEAKLFSTQLFQMYNSISHIKGWQFDSRGNTCAIISGTGVLKVLSYETGIHRVQRVPETEKKGRMQTSSAAVTVLPKESVTPVSFKESELLVETMRSSGHGGQSVNKSETAVRITHLPTGVSVSMREASGQIENKSRALRALAEKLEEMERKLIIQKSTTLKSGQMGNLDRSEKIRTFNFEHDRVTDHRCNASVSGVEDFLRGNEDFDVFHEKLSQMDDDKVSNYVAENLHQFYELIK